MMRGREGRVVKNVMWRMGEECGVLYTEDRQLLRQVLALGKLPVKQEADAATYTNARGRVFAWQVTFSIGQWRLVMRTVGRDAVEVEEEKKPKPPRTPRVPSRPQPVAVAVQKQAAPPPPMAVTMRRKAAPPNPEPRQRQKPSTQPKNATRGRAPKAA